MEKKNANDSNDKSILEYDYCLKLLLVGDSCVGKSNFILRLIKNKFSPSHVSTSGMELKTTKIIIDKTKIRVQLWDTAGQEKYRSVTKSLFNKVQGVLAIYDITSEDSFKNLKQWIKMVKEECSNMQLLMIGNKNDLENERIIRFEEADEYAKSQKMDYIETSSKTGDNINKAVETICKKIIENNAIRSDYSFSLDCKKTKKVKRKCCE